MKDLSRQIMSLLLISTLLIGLIGINLHYHICGATGAHYVFFDEQENPCESCSSCITKKETSSCCSQKSKDCSEISIEDECCSDYTETIELKIKTFTDTVKKVLKRAVAVIVILINIKDEDSKNNNERYISSEENQIIKIPIQKVISFIHISARSAYSS
jgi:hypothetical protein